jgi:hypothetical protein
MQFDGSRPALPRLRTVLAITLTAVLLVSAGCTGVLGGDSAGSDGARLENVPSQSDAVFYADVNGLLDSEAHTTLANTIFAEFANVSDSYDGPTDVDDALNETENSSGVDITEIDAVTGFSSSTESDEYSGAIVETSLSESAFVSAQSETQAYNFSEGEYNGYTFYTPSEEPAFGDATYIGILEDGVYVTGTEAAVKDTIDTEAGDVDAISGEISDAYSETDDGYIRWASAVPQDQVPTNQSNESVPVNTEVFSAVELVSGSHSAVPDTVSLSVNMMTNSGSAAEDVKDATDGAVSLASAYVEDDQAQENLRQINVTSDGTTVSVSYENSTSSIQDLIRTYIQLFLGMGMGP